MRKLPQGMRNARSLFDLVFCLCSLSVFYYVSVMPLGNFHFPLHASSDVR